jgi:hypothetical protein
MPATHNLTRLKETIVNLKTIITTAGFCLLSLYLSGLASAKPAAAHGGISDVAVQQDQDDPDDCGFAYALIYGDGCWVRVDQCGNATVHGCCDEAALQFSSTFPQAEFVPAWLKKETD